MDDEKILLSKKEAAHLLSVSPRTIDYLINRGELRPRRIGRRVLLPRRQLEIFARRDHKTRSDASGVDDGGRQT